MTPANDNTPAVECISIDGRVVTESTRTAHGVIVPHSEIGKTRFFVAHIDAEGYEHPVWDGSEYGAAIAAAGRMRVIVGLAVPIRGIAEGVAR